MLFNPQLILTGKGWPIASRALAVTLNVPAIILAISTAGYAASGDGGGGLYNRVAVQPSHAGKFQSNDGAWWELVNTDNNVKQFAAVGDNTADDTTAFNNASAYSTAKRSPIAIPAGTYKITGTITRSDYSSFIGTDKWGSIIAPVGNFVLWNFIGNYCATNNFYTDNANKTGGVDIRFDLTTAGKSLIELYFDNLFSDQAYGAVDDAYTSGGWIHYRIYFTDCKWARIRGAGFNITRGFAYWYVDEKCLVERVGATASNFTGFSFNGTGLPGAAGGLHLGITVAGNAAVVGTNTSQKGIIITACAAVFFRHAYVDSNGGEGVLCDTCNNLYFEGLTSALNDGYQLRLLNCQYIYGTQTIVLRGRNTVTFTATVQNMLIDGASSFIQQYVAINSNEPTADGVYVNLGTQIIFNNILSNAPAATYRSYVCTAAAGFVTCFSASFAANSNLNYTIQNASGQQRLINTIINSGALTALATSPATA